MNEIGVETWVMHGTLLGWWWNREILPWDSDADVQMSLESMQYLAEHYNMTVHHFREQQFMIGRDYMMEINPNYLNGSTNDQQNVIDARWIDTQTGLFIDITTLRLDEVAERLGYPDRMICKDNHRYVRSDIYPLRDSTFENVSVKVPFSYAKLLEREYGKGAIMQKKYDDYVFDDGLRAWIQVV